MTAIFESDVEEAAIGWLSSLAWETAFGPEVAPEIPSAERPSFDDVVLQRRFSMAVSKLNSHLPKPAVEEAIRKALQPQGTSLQYKNRAFHQMLVDGIQVEYQTDSAETRGANVKLIDFSDPSRNNFLAVNQFTVVENGRERRLDIVLFVNGLPLVLIELKNPTDENATIWSAWQQFQTYKKDLPALFSMNAFLIISDGLNAKIGTLTAQKNWFKSWKTMDGEAEADPSMLELEVLLKGTCAQHNLLSLVRNYIVIEDDGSGQLNKIMAGYHQFHAVEKALAETCRAGEIQKINAQSSNSIGDRRIGVVWHTQGSGKSLTMAFYVRRIILEPVMKNPTLLVLTDRNDLDDQLFGTFSRCRDLFRQTPIQASNRADLRRNLSVESGGVVFSTIQKFFPDEMGDRHPALSERSNIVVIADEAHRSQYDFISGFARHMRDALPNASFIGFTGTPIESTDANTRAVFGDYISIYDIQQSVEDQSTVPIYYESRLAQLALDEEHRPKIDSEFEEVTEGEEQSCQEKLKTKWAQLEAVAGTEKRLKLIAEDIVSHFEARLEVLDGKAMIVCMSRRICVDLHRLITSLRPSWHDEDDDAGQIKVIMTGSASDPENWQQHFRNKSRREKLARRFRDPDDPFQVVIVRDMWLTGFDAPKLHTMYVDKPMRGHGLMQAIARVNRVFRDKPGGLIVDYLGLAHELKAALKTYTSSGGKGKTTLNQAEAIAVMLEKFEICQGLFHHFDYSVWKSNASTERLQLLPAACEFILAQNSGKERLVKAVRELSQAFALAVPAEEAIRIRDDVGFFQSVKAALTKRAPGYSKSDEDIDHALRQIVSKAVASEDVIDIFSAAGLIKPNVGILSEEFLAEVQGLPHRNLAVELLQKLLKGEISMRKKKNFIQARSFAEMLEQTLRRYENRAIEAAQVIEELIQLARDIREASARGKELGLNDDELAFYDALETNESAVKVLGDQTLRLIAQELVKTVRSSVTIDWSIREHVRANIRRQIKRILRKHGYPPDKRENAARTVLQQAELLSANWSKEK